MKDLIYGSDIPAGLRHWQKPGAENEGLVAIAFSDIAETERDMGDYESAGRNYRESLRIARVIDDQEGVAKYIGNLAGLAISREHWSKAEELEREALELAEKLGRQELIAEDLRWLATALIRRGKFDEAFKPASRAAGLCQSLGHRDLRLAEEVLHECEERQ